MVTRKQEADNQRLVDLREQLESACLEAGFIASELTREQFRALRCGISDRATREFGGFRAFIERLFPEATPVPANPLRDIDLVSGTKLSEKIKFAIADCANELEIAPSDVSFAKFKHYANMRYGKNDRGLESFAISDAGGFNAVRDAYFPPRPTRQAIDKARLQKQAAMNRQLGSAAMETEYTFQRIEEYTKGLFEGASGINTPNIIFSPSDETYHLVISDNHFGSDIRKSTTGLMDFGVVEECRRMASVVRQLLKRVPNSNKHNLVIWMLGDLLENKLHSPKDGDVTARQVSRAMYILMWVVRILLHHFKSVHIEGLSGNHDRFPHIDPKRAINDKSDSFATVIYSAIKMAFAGAGNLTFNIPETPFSIHEVSGWRYMATHGDTFFSVGNVNKSLPLDRLVNAANIFNQERELDERINTFIFGHHHTYAASCPNGEEFIFNGPLPPPNSFAQCVGASIKSQCGQAMFVTTKESSVAYSALLKVGRKDDADSSLDEIIPTWLGY